MEEKEFKRIFKGLKIGLILALAIILIAIVSIIKIYFSPQKEVKPKDPEKETEIKAGMVVQVLSPVIISPLLEGDALILSEIIIGVKERLEKLIFISVLSLEGEVLAHTDFDKIGEVEEIKEGMEETESLYIYTAPVKLKDKTLAFLKLGLNKDEIIPPGVETRRFPQGLVIFLCSLFLIFLLVSILLTSRAQKSAWSFLEKYQRELHYLRNERGRLQNLLNKPKKAESIPQKIQPSEKKVSLEPLSVTSIESAIDGIFAHFTQELKTKPQEAEIIETEKQNIEPQTIDKEEILTKATPMASQSTKEAEELLNLLNRSEEQRFAEVVNIGEIPVKTEVGRQSDLIESKPLHQEPQTGSPNNLGIDKILKEITHLREEYQKRKVSPPVALENFCVMPSIIVPGENATIKFTLSDDASIIVTIEGSDNSIVRIFNLKGEKGENTLTWEGKNIFGQFVPPGEYKVLVKEKRLNNVKTIAEPIKITLTEKK